MAELRLKNTDAFQTIDAFQLRNSWREIEYRLENLRATKGEHLHIM